jgi:hypothetical protein
LLKLNVLSHVKTTKLNNVSLKNQFVVGHAWNVRLVPLLLTKQLVMHVGRDIWQTNKQEDVSKFMKFSTVWTKESQSFWLFRL